MRIVRLSHMNYRHYILGLIICLSSFSCRKQQPELFEIDMFFDINIPVGLNTIEDHFFIIEDVPNFYAAQLSVNGFVEADVDRILGATGVFTTRVSGLNLDIIADMGIHVLDKEDPSIRKELLYVFGDQIPFGTKTEIPLIGSIVNVKDYFNEETVDLELKINFRGFATEQIDGRVQFKLIAYGDE